MFHRASLLLFAAGTLRPHGTASQNRHAPEHARPPAPAAGRAGPSLGLGVDLVTETPTRADFPLVQRRQAAAIYVDTADFPGVRRAAADLRADVERVTGVRPALVSGGQPTGGAVVITGTLGKSSLIDRLARTGKLDTHRISGQWESFVVETVANPVPGIERALVIAGSDKRGTIYGIYEISEQIGVSPWYWWADVPAQHHEALAIKSGAYVQGPPVVKYRGIFINDEEPALGMWSREKFGGVNSKMYTHMFELLLRLRGNYLWPAMWGKAFNEDDPDDARLADEYGVVMGTSHHEPMIRAQKEWTTHHAEYGNGQWNYLTNADGLRRFWAEGIERNKIYESVVTVGMRGDGDVPMPDAGGPEANKQLLERIITDQRTILGERLERDPRTVPQLWALFTEVQKYYDAGLRVPDDVTLLFTDDNVGNLRRVPTDEERTRTGGAGIYFHMDMNGGPFSYKWLNSNPLPKVWEQMNLAYRYGATRIWIANVGDLKPLELPLEFFLRMAWNPEAMTPETVAAYQQRWAAREFGPAHAAEIADLVAKYAKYAAWRKPELIRPETFSLVQYREAERVTAAWHDLVTRAERLAPQVPSMQRDAYYELVLHPIVALSNFVELYVGAGRNQLFAAQGRASANAQAALVRELFKKDHEQSDYYNTQLAGGKWNHMMDQTHIGYRNWQSPPRNIMPQLEDLTVPGGSAIGIAIDGSTDAWPGTETAPTLPPLNSVDGGRSYIDVFARGTARPTFAVTSDRAWIHLTEDAAPYAGDDRRVWVDVDWSKAPTGRVLSTIVVSSGETRVAVNLTTVRATQDEERRVRGSFGGLTGPIAIAADEPSRNVATPGAGWRRIPDLGRGNGAMEVFPVTAPTMQPPAPAPRLEYPVYFARAGAYDVDVITSPTLDVIPTRSLALAVSIDDQPPQTVKVFTPATAVSEDFLGAQHYQNTANNARTMHFKVTVATPGRHTLKIVMVDPTVVIQKITLHDVPLPTSYFGPPERARNGSPR